MDRPRPDRREVRVGAIWLVLAGAVLVLLSFRFLDWYATDPGAADSAGRVTFGALHDSADQLGGAGFAIAYFNWLSWAALIAVIVVGVWAALPSPASDALRVLGFGCGLVGIIGTYYALRQHANATGSVHDVFDNATCGVWAALAGYLLAGIGAVLGPRTARR